MCSIVEILNIFFIYLLSGIDWTVAIENKTKNGYKNQTKDFSFINYLLIKNIYTCILIYSIILYIKYNILNHIKLCYVRNLPSLSKNHKLMLYIPSFKY